MPKDYRIDWKKQWEDFAPGFQRGQLRLRPYGLPKVRLKAGPGFGDLSHPTTRLMLALMKGRMRGKRVLDIGCGSGILSLAAYAWGAYSVTGIDICDQALKHAQENAMYNKMKRCRFILPQDYRSQMMPDVVLLNMIYSEQQQALKSLAPLHGATAELIVSGLLAEQIKLLTRYGAISEIREEERWVAAQLSHVCFLPQGQAAESPDGLSLA